MKLRAFNYITIYFKGKIERTRKFDEYVHSQKAPNRNEVKPLRGKIANGLKIAAKNICVKLGKYQKNGFDYLTDKDEKDGKNKKNGTRLMYFDLKQIV